MAKIYQSGDIVLQNWVIEKLIGEGSYGKVYQIGRDDFGTHYSAALKIISVPQSEAERRSIVEEGLTNKEVTQYFYTMVEEIVKEFALMAQFKGTTNIVSYEDHQVVEEKDGNGWDIFIRMELLTPLQTHLASNPISQADVAHLAVDLCKALELCQKYNVIHRDIKPENIFISQNGDFKLGDFGIARTIERTSSGLSKKGTYSYMAPEVYRGLEYGYTVDTYSLGLVLYRLLNQNRLPFMPTPPAPLSFSDREKALATRISGSSLPLPWYGQGGLAEIICKACSYDPAQRYPSATSLRLAVESLGTLSHELLQTDLSSVPHSIPTERTDSHSNRQYARAPQASTDTDNNIERTERTSGIFSTEQQRLSSQQTINTREAQSKNSPWLLAISLVAVVSLSVGLGFFMGGNRTQSETVLADVPEQSNSDSGEDSIPTLEGQIINAPGGVNIRAGASFNSNILTIASEGSTVEILSDAGNGWYEISFIGVNGKEIGYILEDYIDIDQGNSYSGEDSIPTWEGEIMSDTAVTIHVGASSDSGLLTFASTGSKVEILRDTGNGWYEIYINGVNGKQIGYILKDSVAID